MAAYSFSSVTDDQKTGRIFLFIFIISPILLSFCISATRAADITISDAAQGTNGSTTHPSNDNPLLSGQGIRVTGGGSVTVNSVDAVAIDGSVNSGNSVTLDSGASLNVNSRNRFSDSFGIRIYGNTSSILVTGVIGEADNTVNVGERSNIYVYGDEAYGIYGRYNNSITFAGNILTEDYDSEGIYVFNNNTIDSSGTITTNGSVAEGISVGSYNVVTNSGMVNTFGMASVGMYADDFNKIISSGTINTSGVISIGLQAGSNNTITTSGAISTIANQAAGVYVDDSNTLAIGGAITTAGDNAVGLSMNDSNTLHMTGDIVTTGSYSEGIYANDNNTVWLLGNISTGNNYSDGISLTDFNNLTITGTILSDGVEVSNVLAYGTANVINISSTLTATGTGACSIYSGNEGGTQSNLFHILNGSAITGDIHNGDSSGNGTSLLTFGFATATNGTAVLTANDSLFSFTFNDSITSDSSGRWDGYLAGGVTTLNGGTNLFRNLFVGGDSFETTTLYSGSVTETVISKIAGATATLAVNSNIDLSGGLAVGSGSTLSLGSRATARASGNSIVKSGASLGLNIAHANSSKLTVASNLSLENGSLIDIGFDSCQENESFELIRVGGNLIDNGVSVNLQDSSWILDYTYLLSSGSGGTLTVTASQANSFYSAAGNVDKNLGSLLDRLGEDHPSSMDGMFLSLHSLANVSEVKRAERELNNADMARASVSLQRNAVRQSASALESRLEDSRTIRRVSIEFSAEFLNSEKSRMSARASCGGTRDTAPLSNTENKLGGFFKTYGGFGQEGSDADYAGYDLGNVGAMAGIDYRFSNELTAGWLIDYSYNRSNLYSNLGYVSDNTIRSGLYSSFDWDGFFVGCSPTAGLHMLKSHREISFMDTSAESERTGFDVSLGGRSGYNINLPAHFVITPSYSLQFSTMYDPEYTETGAASGANLRVSEHVDYSLLQIMKLNLRRYWKISDHSILCTEAWGGWENEYLPDTAAVTSAFADYSASNWTSPVDIGSPSKVFFGVGVKTLLRSRYELSSRFEQRLWKNGFTSSFSLGLGIRF